MVGLPGFEPTSVTSRPSATTIRRCRRRRTRRGARRPWPSGPSYEQVPRLLLYVRPRPSLIASGVRQAPSSRVCSSGYSMEWKGGASLEDVRTATRRPAIPPSRRRVGGRFPLHDTTWGHRACRVGQYRLARYRQGVPALNDWWACLDLNQGLLLPKQQA